ncbi:invasion protein [Bacillus mycoides]|uniref:transglycosylase SLT domain-containing protein n=1 Tax=Bacillus mycoides TaxID=1405 RepID=UPI0010391E7E|nr:transglycosylase SLT domain-containing protein [Bacillus mycoides]QWG33648.1 invasion protein [Bacillus mycoides]QWG45059.1 invasion protein [Bacillus mycoides]QWH12148.1 invasion protein [Bacillus mycoides]TBX73939.1 invasion protein [Bacillus mycoides]
MRGPLIKIGVFILVLTVGLYLAKSAYDHHTNRAKVRDTIQQISIEHGIPPWITLSIAFHESKFDRNAVGDQGTSFGLFQLHRGGLAPKDLTNEDLKNAETNTRIAISNMINAYNRGLQQNLKGPELLKHVANTSGWPGNKGVQWTDKQTDYNKGLEKSFKMFSKRQYDFIE